MSNVYRYVNRSIYGAEDLDGHGRWTWVSTYQPTFPRQPITVPDRSRINGTLGCRVGPSYPIPIDGSGLFLK